MSLTSAKVTNGMAALGAGEKCHSIYIFRACYRQTGYEIKTATCYPFRGRRNLLTFSEETLLYAAIIFYFLLESGAFVSIYQLQDSIGPDAVFYTMHILFAVFDLFFMV